MKKLSNILNIIVMAIKAVFALSLMFVLSYGIYLYFQNYDGSQTRIDQIKFARSNKKSKTKTTTSKPPKISKAKSTPTIKNLGTNHLWIHKNYFGEKWPLTVDSCEIKIFDTRKYIMALRIKGKVFALNGRSQSRFEALTSENIYWKDTGEYIVDGKKIKTKVGIGPLIKFATDICDRANKILSK